MNKMTRNKSFLLIAAFLLIQFNIQAQDFRFGVLGGIDVTSNRVTNPVVRDDPRSYGSMMSFNINGYLGYESSSFWGLSFEPGFIRKGGIDDNQRIQLNYLQLPVLFDLCITKWIFVSLGPEFSYLINPQSVSLGMSSIIWDSYSRSFEVSGLIGLSIRLTRNFDVGVRYSHGLTWISKVIYYETDNDKVNSKEFNQYLQLVVRFKL
jgi:hypothetical protein